jgi:hypothetical protein
MFMFCPQNAGKSHDVNIVNKSFKSGAKFRHLGMTARNQICIYEEVKSGLNLENACNH